MTGPIVDSVDALAALVSDGAKIALYKGQGAPMALIRVCTAVMSVACVG